MNFGKIKTDAILTKINKDNLTDEIISLEFMKLNLAALDTLRSDIETWISNNISNKNIDDGKLNAYSVNLNQESFGSLCRIIRKRDSITDCSFIRGCVDKDIFDEYCSMLESIYDKVKDKELIDGYKIDNVGDIINQKTEKDIHNFSKINRLRVWTAGQVTLGFIITSANQISEMIESITVKNSDLVTTVKIHNNDFELLTKMTENLSDFIDLAKKDNLVIPECNSLFGNAKTIVSRCEMKMQSEGR